MSDTKVAKSYPQQDQYRRWKDCADELGYNSISQFIADMVEAGLKKFTVDVEPDETNQELREQRNDLKQELEHTRSRVTELEEQLYQGERGEIISYVQDNPGADIPEIIRHLQITVPGRVRDHVYDIEGDELVNTGDGYRVDDEEIN